MRALVLFTLCGAFVGCVKPTPPTPDATALKQLSSNEVVLFVPSMCGPICSDTISREMQKLPWITGDSMVADYPNHVLRFRMPDTKKYDPDAILAVLKKTGFPDATIANGPAKPSEESVK